MATSKYPKTLVHPDIKDAEITAATPSSERAHKASGWVEKKSTSKSTGKASSTDTSAKDS